MKTYGLLGHPLTHSFSKGYFTDKFNNEQIDACYLNFDLPDLSGFLALFDEYPELAGMNVTIPYKQQVIPFLDALDPEAEAMGAVNVIRVTYENGRRKLTGYNSDYKGFADSISPLLPAEDGLKALVLGTGGASKAVVYALQKAGIQTTYVSRQPVESGFTYADLTPALLGDYRIIVNTSPVGMYPHVNEKPLLPYDGITASHICYDLIYNPEETEFLAEARRRGAVTCNGSRMLEGQALEAWRIWNQPDGL